MIHRRDLLKAGLATVAARDLLAAPPARERPPMEVILWCWDARMTWDDQPDAISRHMAGETSPFPYLKRPESFLIGFKRLVDYAARIGVRAIVVWGFLRDAHGGEEAARELCRYAADRGVGILPGVGLCSYGGYYFEGNHRFNLQRYLAEHPDRAGRARQDDHPAVGGRVITPMLDPSLEANRRWWLDGLEWMLETFQIGGINFEMGDYCVNLSAEAEAARKALGFDTNENIQDIVVATRSLAAAALKALPTGLFINSTYRGYHQIKGFPNMPYVHALPAEAVWQYTLTNLVKRDDFPDAYQGAPPHRRYGYLHWFNSATNSMETDFVPPIARVWPAAHRLGFEFLGTYGEVSAAQGRVADRNYRAQVAWARNPRLSAEDFGR